LIEAFLKEKVDASFSYLTSLKDVVPFQPSENPDFSYAASSGSNSFPFLCSITNLPADGEHRMFCIASCGHMFSEKALREVQTSTCLLCDDPYQKDADILEVNPGWDEVQVMAERLISRMQARKLEKERKKKMKKEGTNAQKRKVAVTTEVCDGEKTETMEHGKKVKY
jgi:hypothetical protein